MRNLGERLLVRLDALIHRVIPVPCRRSHLHLPVSYTSSVNTANTNGSIQVTYLATK
jgi:hypothetical protein